MSPKSPDPHMTRIWREAAIALFGGLAIVAAPVFLLGPRTAELSDAARILGWTAFVAAGVTWAMVFGVRLFAQADEFLRDRDKTAWLWGGLGGVAASAPVYAFVMFGGPHWLDPSRQAGRDVAHAFSMGFALPIVAQLAGYVVVATWLKARGR